MATGIKILITTYSTAFLRIGGGEVEMIITAEMLRQCGAEVDIYGSKSRPIYYYDFVIHFSVVESGLSILLNAKEAGKRIFLYPNVWWAHPPCEKEINRIKRLISVSYKLIFKSYAELNNFRKYISIEDNKVILSKIPIQSILLNRIDESLAFTYTGMSKYALCIGLLEPTKNQLAVIRSLNSIKMNAVFIGGVRDEAYAKKCYLEAHPRIKFLPFIAPKSALMLSLFMGASVVVEPSFDPPGRSVIESAILKRPVLIGGSEWQNEYFSDNCWAVSPNSTEEITKGIVSALNDSNKDVKIENARVNFLTNNLDTLVGTRLIKSLLDSDE
jgi:glycosyltransferase involved in cell wall biosynthesis